MSFKRLRRTSPPASDDSDDSASYAEARASSPSPLPRLRRRADKVAERAAATMRLTRNAHGQPVAEVAPGLDRFAAVREAALRRTTPGAPARPDALRPCWTSANPFAAARGSLSAALRVVDSDEDGSSSGHYDDWSESSDRAAAVLGSDSDDDSRHDEASDDSALSFVVDDAAPPEFDSSTETNDDEDSASYSDGGADSDSDDYSGTPAVYRESDSEDDDPLQATLCRLRASRGMEQRERFAAALYYAVRSALDARYAERLEGARSEALRAERMMVRGGAARQVWAAPGVRAAALIRSAAWLPGVAETLDCCPAWNCERLARGETGFRGVCEACGRQRSIATVRLTVCGPPHGAAAPELAEELRHYDTWDALAVDRGASFDDDTPVAQLPRVVSFRVGADCLARMSTYLALVHAWGALARRCAEALRPLRLAPKAAADRLLDGHEPELVAACWEQYQVALAAADESRFGWGRPSFLEATE